MPSELLEPKEIEVSCINGTILKVTISKFPSVAGREIVAGYPLTAMPKFSEYKSNEEMMFKLMAFVDVTNNQGFTQRMITRALIENFIPDWEALAKIEFAMMQYNTSFLDYGKISSFSETIAAKALAWSSKILTPLLARLSEAAKQRSKN